MPQFGTIKRVKPRVRVLRGYNPQEPHQLSQAAPVSELCADGTTPNANGIKSGQVMSLIWVSADSEYQWALGGAAGLVPYIALNDSVDYDVIEAGKMPGLSSAGQFEIQTAYFKSSEAASFVVDALVTYDGITGDIKLWVQNTTAAGQAIMGHVTRNHGSVNLGSVGDGTPATGGNNGVDSSATTLDVVVFTTHYQAKVGVNALT